MEFVDIASNRRIRFFLPDDHSLGLRCSGLDFDYVPEMFVSDNDRWIVLTGNTLRLWDVAALQAAAKVNCETN